MNDWTPPPRPAQLTETRLIQAILDGSFPIGSSLPPERELAQRLGITRPTLREVLQHLARDGWLEIHHGRATRVRDYHANGSLGVLAAMALYDENLPPEFVPNLLQTRCLLAPEYTRLAIENNPAPVLAVLQDAPTLPDEPNAYAQYDWRLHHSLAHCSGNFVFVCFLNSMQHLSQLAGQVYFEHNETRVHSAAYYRALYGCLQRSDATAGQELTRRVMTESLDFWKKFSPTIRA